MKKFILLIFTVLSGVSLVFSQSGNVLVVPFGDRMFYNEATSSMLKASGFSYSEMINYLESSLVSEIQKQGGRGFISCTGAVTTGEHQDLKSEVRSLLDFYLKPISDVKKRKVGLFGRPSSKLEGKKEKADIKNGETVSLIGDNKTSYIASKVNSKRQFARLVKDVGVGKVLVINEFDIKEDRSSPYNNGNEYLRQIQAHFTVFDSKGNPVAGGVAVENFSSSENDIKKIVKSHFPNLVKQIIQKI